MLHVFECDLSVLASHILYSLFSCILHRSLHFLAFKLPFLSFFMIIRLLLLSQDIKNSKKRLLTIECLYHESVILINRLHI